MEGIAFLALLAFGGYVLHVASTEGLKMGLITALGPATFIFAISQSLYHGDPTIMLWIFGAAFVGLWLIKES